MTAIVISQPMFFPWVGMLEQIRLADVYVHYDDVQFSKGSFTNRVQVKTADGTKWLSVPLLKHHLGQHIDQVLVEPPSGWANRHLALLEQAYRDAPHCRDMLALVGAVYARPFANLAELAVASMEAVLSYFGMTGRTRFVHSSALGIAGHSDDRVLAIVKHFGGSRYITGHGAKNYLDHQRFADAGVEVEYLDYRKIPYSQLHGAFTPYVSVLDLIANLGPSGAAVIVSPSVNWRQFLANQSPEETK